NPVHGHAQTFVISLDALQLGFDLMPKSCSNLQIPVYPMLSLSRGYIMAQVFNTWDMRAL
ncbi:hypothetical protein ABTL95_20200, partial [Acinetobacter baumannii]